MDTSNGFGMLLLLVISAFLSFLVINYVIYKFRDVIEDFFYNLFHPLTKTSIGKVISCRSRTFLDPPFNLTNNLFGPEPTQNICNFIPNNRYFVYLEDKENKSRYLVLVKSDLFEKIKKHKIFNKDVYVIVFTNKYFLLGSFFDHVELLEEKKEKNWNPKKELVIA